MPSLSCLSGKTRPKWPFAYIMDSDDFPSKFATVLCLRTHQPQLTGCLNRSGRNKLFPHLTRSFKVDEEPPTIVTCKAHLRLMKNYPQSAHHVQRSLKV